METEGGANPLSAQEGGKEEGFTEEDLKELTTFDEIELGAIVQRYKKIEGEWTLKDIERFA